MDFHMATFSPVENKRQRVYMPPYIDDGAT